MTVATDVMTVSPVDKYGTYVWITVSDVVAWTSDVVGKTDTEVTIVSSVTSLATVVGSTVVSDTPTEVTCVTTTVVDGS